MHENIDIIYNIVPLLATIEEALQHSKQQLAQLRYEEALGLLEDATIGILCIGSAIKPMQSELNKNKIEPLGAILESKISQVVGQYEMTRQVEVAQQIDQELMEMFKNWRQEIERVLKAYITAWKSPKRDYRFI